MTGAALYELDEALKGCSVRAGDGKRMQLKGVHQERELPRSGQAGAIDAWQVHHQRYRGLFAHGTPRDVGADEARRAACSGNNRESLFRKLNAAVWPTPYSTLNEHCPQL